jgi:perosamine synthetase
MIPVARPYVGEEEIAAVTRVIRSGQLAQGPEVAAFESEFADFCGAPYALAVTNGTVALQLALMALGIGEDDEVITTPFSFIATAEAIREVGARPVFCDVDLETYNINPSEIEKLITKSTRAILPVHLYGHPAEMKAINEIAQKHQLLVVEDACQAHGAVYHGQKTGALGDAAAFSFYATKNMQTGEGGMVTFRDKKVYELAKKIRAHGSAERYRHDVHGLNFRMTDMLAAIGRVQLQRLPGFNEARQGNANFLMEHIKNPKVFLPIVREGCGHVFHQFTVRIEDLKGFDILDRDKAVKSLADLGVGTGLHYDRCITEQQVYTSLGYRAHQTPLAVQAARTVLSLPVYPGLTNDNLQTIVQAINDL